MMMGESIHQYGSSMLHLSEVCKRYDEKLENARKRVLERYANVPNSKMLDKISAQNESDASFYTTALRFIVLCFSLHEFHTTI